MNKLKVFMGGLIAALCLCFIFVLNAKAAEVGTYTYTDADGTTATLEVIDESNCKITTTKNGATITMETGYTDKDGNIYVEAIDTEFKIGLAETLTIVEKAAESDAEDTGLELDEDTLNQLIDIVGKFNNGEYSTALTELKTLFGVVGAFAIICVLICFLFIIKYFKQSAMLKAIQSKMTEEQATQTNTYINNMEDKVNTLLDTYMKKMQGVDADKKAQLQEMLDAVDTKLNSIK